ncbi:MAG: FGGY family carbohydrate kinase [Victivallaceae bacterium]
MEYVAAIDIGTSRIKAALIGEDGLSAAVASTRLDRAAEPGTQDAAVWVDESFSLLARLISEHPELQICAVAPTGNMHAMLPVDAAAKPLLPAWLWSNNLAEAESERLNRDWPDFFRDKAGNRCTPVFTLPKLVKFKREHAGLYAKTCKFLQSKDLVAAALTGEFHTDVSDASGVLAMELGFRRWSDDLLGGLGVDPGKLPDILESSQICGHVTPEAARRTGLAAGTPVAIGAGDLATAALGGGVDGETLSLTLGTAGQLLGAGAPGEGRGLFGKLFVFAHADPEKELYLASVPAGGFVFEWFARNHNIAMDEFFRLAASAELKVSSPVFMPYILGRGAPYMDYEPCGAWHGLSAAHGIGDLCLSAVFGTLSALRQGADLMTGLIGGRRKLTLQALACRELAVRRTACGLFRQGCKQLPRNEEASLLGAAMLGFVACGRFATVGEAERAMFRADRLDSGPDAVCEVLFEKYLAHAGNL